MFKLSSVSPVFGDDDSRVGSTLEFSSYKFALVVPSIQMAFQTTKLLPIYQKVKSSISRHKKMGVSSVVKYNNVSPQSISVGRGTCLIHFQAHSIVDFVICESDMILVDGIPILVSVDQLQSRRHCATGYPPFLELDFGGISARLGSNQLL